MGSSFTLKGMDFRVKPERLAGRVLPRVRELLAALRERRATSLAAVAAFYGLLSIPPLLVGLVATAALVAIALGPEVVDRLTDDLLSAAGRLLSPEATADLVRPMITEVLDQPRPVVLSLGYLFAIWSASRMVNAVIQGIELLTEQDELRSNLSTRWLAVKALLIGLVVITVVLPLLAVGPANLLAWTGVTPVLLVAVWVLVGFLAVLAVGWFYRTAVPRRPPWPRALIGAVFAVTGWGIGSLGLQIWLSRATSGASLYGPLSAPIALLLWLQMLALVTLIGAAIAGRVHHR